MQVHWIWLAHRPKVTDRQKAVLWQRFRDAEDVYFAGQQDFAGLEGMTREAVEALEDKDLSGAQKILEECREKGLEVLTLADEGYPHRLRHIPDPPMVLYYKGKLPKLDECPVIGVVGTRKASAYGLSAAYRMGYQLASGGAVVVSGMAKGIDSMAMEGALLAGKTTVGVLGCGADLVYPLSNKKLFDDTARYGCILSEFAPGTPAAKWTFPRRNRIISGLSCGVLVVEAPEKSGALITAGQALEQGRDVFVVPGNIDQPGFVGSNRLLRDGAGMAACGWDILREYEGLYPDKVHRQEAGRQPEPAGKEPETPVSEEVTARRKPAKKSPHSGKKSASEENLEKKAIDNSASGSYSDVNDLISRLSREEQAVVMTLREGERLVDDVIAETGLSTGKLLAVLTILELKGVIRRLPGKRITLK